MKTRLLIIIGLIIVIIISVSALIIIDNIEPRNQQAISDTPFAPHTGLGILHALSVADKEKLQNVLDNCDCQESGQTPCKLPRLSYQNDTHSIDNLDCEWVTISNEERDVKLAAGYKLYPGVGWVAPADQNTMEPIYRIHPETGEKVLDLDAVILAQKILDKYKDLSEVVAFYAKYDGVQVSVREDHISYFTGNEDDFKIRMNLEFDENYEINNIELHCYVKRIHQNEVAQSFILKYLKDYTCDEYGSQRTGNIQISGDMADQICPIIGDECPSYFIGNMQKDGSVMVGIVVSNQDQIKQYQFFIKNNILSYDVTINEN